MEAKKILILGGGFGGLYAALEFEKALKKGLNAEVTLVNRDNFFLFTPMLHEVAGSDLDCTHIVNPIHKLLKRVNFFCGNVDKIDLSTKIVTVSHGLESHSHELPFDHVVLALGAVTNFFNNSGLRQYCRTMKSLEDAIELRSHLISLLEEANFECCKEIRDRLLTVVVAGAGFAGVETIASVYDFLDESLECYTNLKEQDLRVILVNAGKVVLPELSEKLGKYAEKKLTERGVRIISEAKVKDVQQHLIELTNGTKIETTTLVWTAGNACNPLIKSLALKTDKDRVLVDEFMQSPDMPGVWALGDCAAVPDRKGGFHPPTAQHASREGKILAHNIIAELTGGKKKPFTFVTIGQLASLGRRTAVANIMGLNFSGWIAWWMWRTIYLMKLPRFEKKFRVALDWTLDLFFSKDLVQFLAVRAPSMEQAVHLKPEGVDVHPNPAPELQRAVAT